MGRHPKSGEGDVQVAIRLEREIYIKLRILAVERSMLSHVRLAEKIVTDYLNSYKHLSEKAKDPRWFF